MDIGCNEGLVTLRVAARFLCSSMVGVDIDAGLIRKVVLSSVSSSVLLEHFQHTMELAS